MPTRSSEFGVRLEFKWGGGLSAAPAVSGAPSAFALLPAAGLAQETTNLFEPYHQATTTSSTWVVFVQARSLNLLSHRPTKFSMCYIGWLKSKPIKSDVLTKSLIYSLRLADLYLQILPSIASSHRVPIQTAATARRKFLVKINAIF